MSKCNCKWCGQYRKLQKLLKNDKLTLDEKDFVYGIFDEMSHTQADLDFKLCILEGSWPTAVEQLTVALANAKKIRAGKEGA